jgi:phage terminase large subunit-like protein
MDTYEKLQEFSDNEIEEIINNPEKYNDDIIIDAMQIGFERAIISNN